MEQGKLPESVSKSERCLVNQNNNFQDKSADRSIDRTLTCSETTQLGSIHEGSSATEGDTPDRAVKMKGSSDTTDRFHRQHCVGRQVFQREPVQCSPTTEEGSERDSLTEKDAFPDTDCKRNDDEEPHQLPDGLHLLHVLDLSTAKPEGLHLLHVLHPSL